MINGKINLGQRNTQINNIVLREAFLEELKTETGPKQGFNFAQSKSYNSLKNP